VGTCRLTLDRVEALAGIVGPAAFTTAWIVSGIRQDGYPVAHEHISGLAAHDADDPTLMIAGFTVLGAGTIAFAIALRRALGGRRGAGLGPVLLAAGGAAGLAAGFLRRDTFLLNPPDRPDDYRQSWHNDGHDLSAGVIYATSVLAPGALAWRFHRDEAWADLVPGAVASSAASLVLMAIFATDVDRRFNGLLQRLMVTVPQAFMALLALRVLRSEPSSAGATLRPLGRWGRRRR
jgi:Protein of unknown function (DUF998)